MLTVTHYSTITMVIITMINIIIMINNIIIIIIMIMLLTIISTIVLPFPLMLTGFRRSLSFRVSAEVTFGRGGLSVCPPGGFAGAQE